MLLARLPRYRGLLLFLPAWIAFVAYLPALQNGFVWDDTYFITDLPYLRDAELWWQHIREPLFVSHNYFRPLPLLTFFVESQFGGAHGINAFVFHLTNLLLHAANTALVVLLTRVLLRDRDTANDAALPAAAAGLLFALHPALIESVCWISDRFDLLMATFIFVALLAEATVQRPLHRSLMIATCFLLALLCKETSVILFALLPLWQLARIAETKTSWRKYAAALFSRSALLTWAALMVAFGIYLMLRYDALGVFYRRDTLIVPGTGLQHLLLMAKTLGWYVCLLFWPFGQIGPVHPGSTPIALSDIAAWAGLGLLSALAAGLIWLLRKMPRVGFVALAALATLAPVSNYVPLTIGDNMVHDRYLLLPVAFTAIALATGLTGLFRARIKLLTIGLWSCLSLATILMTIPYWKSDLTMWGWAYSLAPQSSIARGNYVAALANNNHSTAVIALCGEILREDPDNPNALHDMALTLMRIDRDHEAREYNSRSLDYYARLGDAITTKNKLDLSESLNLLGVLDMRAGDWKNAKKSFERAIGFTPYLTRPHFNLALVHYQFGDIEAGDREMVFVERYDPPELLPVHRAEASKHRAAASARSNDQGASSR